MFHFNAGYCVCGEDERNKETFGGGEELVASAGERV